MLRAFNVSQKATSGESAVAVRIWPTVVVPPTCCPDGHDYSEPGWSVSSLVYLQRPAQCVALLVREIYLRASARCGLPDPGPWPSLDV
jgi:hypothetical protein